MSRSKPRDGSARAAEAEVPGAVPAGEVLVADEVLVREILAGNADRFELLVLRHQRPLINFLYRMIGSTDQAADLTQEVFTRAFLALDRFDPKWRFTTWLYRIGTNLAIDHLRRQKHRMLSLDEPLAGLAGGLAERIPGRGASPVDTLVHRETSRRLAGAIAALPAPARSLILLRHANHLSYDEIAHVTGLPIGTVKNRIFRARLALRRLLDGGLPAAPPPPVLPGTPAPAARRAVPMPAALHRRPPARHP